MKLKPFLLTMDDISGETVGVATFSALKAIAWTMFSCELMLRASRGENVRELDQTTKLDIAARAFTFVAEELPPDSPFAGALRRFIEEALPSEIDSVKLPPALS